MRYYGRTSVLDTNKNIYLPNNPVAVGVGAPKVLPNAGAELVAVPKVLPKAGAAVVVTVPKLLPNVGATAAVGWPNAFAPKVGAAETDVGAPNVEPKDGCVVLKPPNPVEVVVVVVAVPKLSGAPKPVANKKKINTNFQ